MDSSLVFGFNYDGSWGTSGLDVWQHADLHRAGYGPVGWPEVMHFIEGDGKVRQGHEAFNEFAPSRPQ